MILYAQSAILSARVGIAKHRLLGCQGLTSSLGSAFLDEPPSLLPVIPDSFSRSFSFRSVSVPICSSRHGHVRGCALYPFLPASVMHASPLQARHCTVASQLHLQQDLRTKCGTWDTVLKGMHRALPLITPSTEQTVSGKMYLFQGDGAAERSLDARPDLHHLHGVDAHARQVVVLPDAVRVDAQQVHHHVHQALAVVLIRLQTVIQTLVIPPPILMSWPPHMPARLAVSLQPRGD